VYPAGFENPEVEVDPETHTVKVPDITVVQDTGFATNPLSVEGQMESGATQPSGYGLAERMVSTLTSMQDFSIKTPQCAGRVTHQDHDR
jgi:CO/xanthine dehydrogenase Mo-binding subunit